MFSNSLKTKIKSKQRGRISNTILFISVGKKRVQRVL